MDLSMFDLEGDQDSCHADSNDDLPFDELIYISVYNGYTAESSREDYDDDKDFYDSDPNFMEISDLGDAAFATIKIQFGKLDDTYISILKGVYTIRIEINSDGSNGANDCITTDTVIDFAKAIIAPL